LCKWQESLEFLIEDERPRESLGRNAYKSVKQNFNVQKNAPKYLRVLKDIANTSVQFDEEPEAAYATN
jgi:spore maturation protein CgeB